jgi:hypothetical protein
MGKKARWYASFRAEGPAVPAGKPLIGDPRHGASFSGLIAYGL